MAQVEKSMQFILEINIIYGRLREQSTNIFLNYFKNIVSQLLKKWIRKPVVQVRLQAKHFW